MSNRFNFHTLPGPRGDLTEANIFIHGYSAGHTASDRRTLLDSIPDQALHQYLRILEVESFHSLQQHFTQAARRIRP
jgi:hypothetical protein